LLMRQVDVAGRHRRELIRLTKFAKIHQGS
jgi:hypothetical protein